MPHRSLAFTGALLLGVALSAQSVIVHSFDTDAPGTLPSGFVVAPFRQAAPGSWAVIASGPQQYLAHSAGRQDGWTLAIDSGQRWNGVVLSARLRLAGGARAGGLVWRYQDPTNFRAVLLDLVNHKITGYRISGGNRFTFDGEDGLELDAEAWHTVKVVQESDEVTVSLGGIRVFRDEDRRGARSHDGLVGVLAAGDAEVWVDDLRIGPLRGR